MHARKEDEEEDGDGDEDGEEEEALERWKHDHTWLCEKLEDGGHDVPVFLSAFQMPAPSAEATAASEISSWIAWYVQQPADHFQDKFPAGSKYDWGWEGTDSSAAGAVTR